MRLIACLSLIVTLAVGAVLPGVAAAQPTLDQAVKRIKERGDVKVLSAQRVSRDGKSMYRIKVLTPDGRVKYIWVDAGG